MREDYQIHFIIAKKYQRGGEREGGAETVRFVRASRRFLAMVNLFDVDNQCTWSLWIVLV